jgi:hypothetical protein
MPIFIVSLFATDLLTEEAFMAKDIFMSYICNINIRIISDLMI